MIDTPTSDLLYIVAHSRKKKKRKEEKKITAAGSMSRCGHGTNSGYFKLVVLWSKLSGRDLQVRVKLYSKTHHHDQLLYSSKEHP